MINERLVNFINPLYILLLGIDQIIPGGDYGLETTIVCETCRIVNLDKLR